MEDEPVELLAPTDERWARDGRGGGRRDRHITCVVFGYAGAPLHAAATSSAIYAADRTA